MQQMRTTRDERGRRGFTLVELTATIALLAVIATVAYTHYAEVTAAHQTARAESALGDVLAAQKQLASDYGTYTSWGQDLGMIGGPVHLVPGAPVTQVDAVSMVVGSAGTLGLATLSDTGACIVWRVGPLTTGGGQHVADVSAGQPCTAERALVDPEVPATQTAAVRGAS